MLRLGSSVMCMRTGVSAMCIVEFQCKYMRVYICTQCMLGSSVMCVRTGVIAICIVEVVHGSVWATGVGYTDYR